nr:IS1380 family transposase [uncultured Lichenicoccus sp.]
MSDNSFAPFLFPAVRRKRVTAAFDGGFTLLAAAERRLGLANRLARLIADPRNPLLVTHSAADILRARMLAIACGRLPDSGRDLCSQPTVSRWENAPTLREVIRLSYAMVDTNCASYPRPPANVTLDIDDTVDVVPGHQQLSLFNAHHDERCFMPIHVYDIATSRPVAILLRPGKTPSGHEVRCHVRRLIRRIRSHWPATRLTLRGDGHDGGPEVMAWCEANAVAYIFGLPGIAVPSRLLEPVADDVRTRRAAALGQGGAPVLRRHAEIRYGARSWGCERRVAARIEASSKGLDIRCVVTSLHSGTAEWLYDSLCCACGQAGNLIKLQNGQLVSDRTSCRSARANQVRLVLHTAAYWLMLTVGDTIPKPQPLTTAEFATLRLRLIKIAGRVTKTATRVRIAFAAACPDAELFRGIASSLQPAGP